MAGHTDYTTQHIYKCRKCKLAGSGNWDVCSECVKTCHQGHDLFYFTFGRFACDCCINTRKQENKSPKAPVKARVNDSSTVFVVKDENSNTYREFKCPACFKVMCDAIYMCKNGHNMCGACQFNVLSCPVCRGSKPFSRNLALETLGRSLEIQCQHCGENLRMSALKEHNKRCIVSECPLDLKCGWAGWVLDFYGHCLEKHGEKIYHGAKHDFIHKFRSNEDDEVDLIDMNGSLFLFHRKFTTTTPTLFRGVLKSLEPLEENNVPSYIMQFAAPLGGDGETIQMKNIVRSLPEDVEEIYKLHRGVTLYRNQVINILQLNALRYRLTINGPRSPLPKFARPGTGGLQLPAQRPGNLPARRRSPVGREMDAAAYHK